MKDGLSSSLNENEKAGAFPRANDKDVALTSNMRYYFMAWAISMKKTR
jgi:hypothetical protein